MTMGKPLLRFGVVSLPALLLISSLAALVMSIPAWGAGDHAGLSSWMPPAAGVVIGLPGAVIAVVCLRAVLRSTAAEFSVTPMLLVFGLLTLPIAIGTETAVAVGVADAATYDRLLEEDRVSPGLETVGPPPGPVSPAGFLAGTVVIALFLNGVVAVAASTYVGAITVDAKRFERRPDEPDALGELLKGRQGPHAPQP